MVMTFPKIIDATEAVEAAEAVETFFKKNVRCDFSHRQCLLYMGGVTIAKAFFKKIWEV